ncbi:hypothetical protein LOZ80_25920 [Paenibacillus sp. HWE-109]|nr:hypothetical protein [Paenibacillus sp. HWE-109]UKS25018.1 hypothetical protein LOZ80_25920 [Paenibacillus sp. HWE-109]
MAFIENQEIAKALTLAAIDKVNIGLDPEEAAKNVATMYQIIFAAVKERT